MMSRDDMLPMITAEAMGKALKGFAPPLVPEKDMAWLAMAVRRSLAISIPSFDEGPNRTSNKDIRDELERLAALAGSTWQELFECELDAERRLWRFALNRWDGEGGTETEDGNVLGDPSEHRRFKAAIAELDWLASFMREAARATPSQRGPWKQSENRRLRVERAQYLAPVFEAAFGQRVTANNWPSGTHLKPSSFMDFYQRMVDLAFSEKASPDLSGVVKEACRLHARHPAQFAEGIIPGL